MPEPETRVAVRSPTRLSPTLEAELERNDLVVIHRDQLPALASAEGLTRLASAAVAALEAAAKPALPEAPYGWEYTTIRSQQGQVEVKGGGERFNANQPGIATLSDALDRLSAEGWRLKDSNISGMMTMYIMERPRRAPP